ncbi:MAG: trehalose-phosphatase [Anaerolineae bacterium]|nr:trehalose-phosphatase [Anaerolineae bacterium]
MFNRVDERIIQAKRLWLFLDYDGTLAEFAPTPDHINPDPEVISLLTKLAAHSRLRVAIVSGRSLSHIQRLAPVPGIFLAGSYGIEFQTPTGELVNRVAYATVRPYLDGLKPQWENLISRREGFYLEDKGWTLAIHARFAAADEAEDVLAIARRAACESVHLESFRLLGGHRFLEIGPQLAHKGQTVAYLLEHYSWKDALPLYVGDDDKDEEAFEVVKSKGGIAVLVSSAPRRTIANCRLPTPQATRYWLESFLDI